MSPVPKRAVTPGGTLGTVHWEDEPDRERVVRRLCRSCRWVPVAPLVRLVSPQGIAHEQGTYMREEYTACGKNATSADWWWRT